MNRLNDIQEMKDIIKSGKSTISVSIGIPFGWMITNLEDYRADKTVLISSFEDGASIITEVDGNVTTPDQLRAVFKNKVDINQTMYLHLGVYL